jgi:NAD+ synthase (glutamine-hydrolysing)
MPRILLAAAALNQTPLDWTGNVQRIIHAVEEAKSYNVDLLLLPELAISGYGCEDAFLRPETTSRAVDMLARIASEFTGIHVAVGLPLMHNRMIYNAAALIADGKLSGFYCKKFLAGDGNHYEYRWFRPWPIGVRGTYRFNPKETDPRAFGVDDVPIGDIIFDIDGVSVGFETCEDAWVADRPGRVLAAKGVDIILNPSASHFAFGKHDIRRGFVKDGSRAFAAAYVYANLLGNEAGRMIYDGGCLIAQNGEIIAEGPRFSFSDYTLTLAHVDLDLARRAAAKTASFRTEPGDDPSRVRISTSCDWSTSKDVPVQATEAWEHSPNLRFEEFARAGALGLFDYLRKSRTGGFVISLSGGADSAAVATLVSLMTQFAFRELSSQGVAESLRKSGDEVPTEAIFMHRMLACVYQASVNSSTRTAEASKTVATAIGAQFFNFSIAGIVDELEKLMREIVGKELSWEEFDIPLQNLQARARSPVA